MQRDHVGIRYQSELKVLKVSGYYTEIVVDLEIRFHIDYTALLKCKTVELVTRDALTPEP